MYIENTKLWLYLTLNTNISKTKLYRLYKYFKSAEGICKADAEELKQSKILTDAEVSMLTEKNFDGIDELLSIFKINSVKVVTIEDSEYPSMLLELTSPPMVLYCRGKFINLNKCICIASIGTRRPTAYGKRCTYEIVKKLSMAGFLVVSGMAQGIDAISHMASIDSGCPTVAFVATGVDVIYPKINAELHQKILKTGMIVSEYPLGTMPKKYSFLERNKLIAAVSKGMFLSEASIKSGSSASVSYAVNLGRDLFALPGNITSPMSAEPNELIKAGAHAVTDADDIIKFYEKTYSANLEYAKSLKNEAYDKISSSKDFFDTACNEPRFSVPDGLSDEEKVLFVLRNQPSGIDVISAYTQISINDLNMQLLMMEVNGKIKSDSGIYYPI